MSNQEIEACVQATSQRRLDVSMRDLSAMSKAKFGAEDIYP